MEHKISDIAVFRALVPIKDGVYTMSGGRALNQYDTTLVRIRTVSGLTGWGEVTPLGSSYLPSYPDGARAGIREIAGHLIGEDATQLVRINKTMDEALRGHGYAKSAIDIACWDILGQVAGLPVSVLLGGKFDTRLPLYRSITYGAPEEMVDWIKTFQERGHRQFQLKVGGDPDEDIERIRQASAAMRPGDRLVADANGGWTLAGASRVVNAVRDLAVFIEQPCASYEECLSIRERTTHPFILDESIDSLHALIRAIGDRAMDCINIKLSKVGGLTKARVIRDVCAQNGVMMTIEDTACTDITAAAIMALAQSTPAHLRFSVTLATVKTEFATANGSPIIENGIAHFDPGQGLGVSPIMEVWGDPLFTITS